ncbi:hypothetical protein [Desulfogranum marinum]|uniref:hypothetical protein n=1 Tax=Desulfogranum marinum TaxID=453220 RepID=UPI00196368D6|nr:hypothetical protein [Desulfogranum marinum]MBM9511024.1 hypothetical protein [Desulfogranum marinum]
MHNIQEKDWAEDDWSSHTGMDADSDYCTSQTFNDGRQAEKDVACEKPAQQPFTIDYTFIRRGEAEIVFTFNERKIPVRALFFTDPLLDLTESALQLRKGAHNNSVVFIENSGEHQLVFKREQEGELTFEMRWFAKGEDVDQNPPNGYTVVFEGSTTVDAYSLQVLQILNNIDREPGVEQYKTKWINADFPSEAYCRLKMEMDS